MLLYCTSPRVHTVLVQVQERLQVLQYVDPWRILRLSVWYILYECTLRPACLSPHKALGSGSSVSSHDSHLTDLTLLALLPEPAATLCALIPPYTLYPVPVSFPISVHVPDPLLIPSCPNVPDTADTADTADFLDTRDTPDTPDLPDAADLPRDKPTCILSQSGLSYQSLVALSAAASAKPVPPVAPAPGRSGWE